MVANVKFAAPAFTRILRLSKRVYEASQELQGPQVRNLVIARIQNKSVSLESSTTLTTKLRKDRKLEPSDV